MDRCGVGALDTARLEMRSKQALGAWSTHFPQVAPQLKRESVKQLMHNDAGLREWEVAVG